MAGAVLAGLMSVAANGATGAEKAAPAESPKKDEMKMKTQWVQEHLTDAKAKLPFSFVYDGKASDGLLAGWTKNVEAKKLDANRTEHTLRWTDPKSGLEVRCVAVDYADYPAAEWTVYFKNTGTNDTPILENIQGLDARFERGGGGEFALHGIKGDFDSKDSYQPYVLTLGPNANSRFAPAGGRPSDGEFPYYNLQMPGRGLLLAIGWPGQWAASFTRDATNGLRIVAGQELTRLVLKPGETIRSPLIAMLFWQGDDTVQAQNLWRRWYVAHTLPRRANGETQPAITFFTGYGYESDIAMFQTAIDAGIRADAFWRDAGAGSGEKTWYPSGGNWGNLGTWEVDKTVYPNGFKPLTDWLKVYGMEFILWFEPERVGGTSWLSKNHPEKDSPVNGTSTSVALLLRDS